MDFEVLTSTENEKSFFHEIENFFRDRRRQLQDWEANPPHLFGLFILLAVSLELTLGWRMTVGRGLNADFLPQFFLILFFISMGELALSKVGKEVGEFFKKKGSVLTAYSIFNMGLLPLFLVFPFLVLNSIFPDMGLITFLAILLLISKVLSNFRESLEITFEFNRLQSALVLYLSSGLMLLGIFIAIYISFFSLLTSVLSDL